MRRDPVAAVAGPCGMSGGMSASRIALITGGTRGLGRALALALAESGHVPVLVYREGEEAAREAAIEARARAPEARTYAADIADPAAVAELAARVRREVGPVTVLVNNAFRSGRAPKKTHEVTPEEFAADLAVNLTGQFLVTRAFLPDMTEAGFGRVIFIGSLAARGEAGRVTYSTAKAALAGLAGTIAQEYGSAGITANVVAPGFLETGAFERLAPEIRERALRRVPARRAGRTEEVAALVTHLASDAGGYVNGQVLAVDGGAR